MTLSAHVAVGSAVGLATGNPVAGFMFGWISHHIADATAHSDAGSVGADVGSVMGDQKVLRMVFIDIFLAAAILILFALYTDRSTLVFWGALGGAFPDLVDNCPFWSPVLRKYFPFNIFHLVHETIHCTIKQKKYFWLGMLTQVVAVTVSFCYLFLWWK